MAFNLSEALGFDKVLSNLDNYEVHLIRWTSLKPNEKNFFSVDDIQDLKDSIEMNGILQPLLVVQDGCYYRVVAGHRRLSAAKALVAEGKNRFKEIPCIILPEMSEAMEWMTIIQTNTAARELTHAEKAEAAIRMKKQLVKLKEEGVQIPGSLRTIVAEQLEISKTEVARMEVIDKNLHEEFKPLWKNNSIDASCAYALAKLPKDDQSELLQSMTRNGCRMTTPIVDDYILQKKCQEWSCKDCPYPDTPEKKEKVGKGWKFPCYRLKTMEIKHWSSDGKCVCCAKCDEAARCLDACAGAKVAALEKARYQREQAKKATKEALRNLGEETFERSPLAGMRDRIADAISKIGFNYDDVSDACTDYFDKNFPYEEDTFIPYSVIKDLAEAKTAEDIPIDFALVLALCESIYITPDWLFGMSGQRASWWHPYPETRPNEGQRVVVRRTVGDIVRSGEYIYRDNDWYEPGLDDFKMNITGVTHWIECPEV